MQGAARGSERAGPLPSPPAKLRNQLEGGGTAADSPRSPLPRSRHGLLQSADRLVRQAASLEEEAKRAEAQAYYCMHEAEHLAGGGLPCQRSPPPCFGE